MKMITDSFSFLGHYLIDFLIRRVRLSGSERERLRWLLAGLFTAMEEGHSCLPLGDEDVRFLLTVDLVSTGSLSPLVVHRGRLYPHRLFFYENRLVEQITEMVARPLPPITVAPIAADGEQSVAGEIDLQEWAAEMALNKSLTIIAGGPGTGKTTTVLKILVLLLEQLGHDLKIVLAAPTGKAAMRLRESVLNSLATMQLHGEYIREIAAEAKTLHRLLGVRGNSPQFLHNRSRPLAWDVVVVDEASMVDLALMSKLMDGLKPNSKLILLGDQNQLASVESGAVFVDLLESLPENSVRLQKTYRFDAAIKMFAESINRADTDRAWGILTDMSVKNITLLEDDLITYMVDRYAEYMEAVLQTDHDDIYDLFRLFGKFQVLCAVRQGWSGVDGINKRVELSLARRGFFCKSGGWYPGRPVMVNSNDYGLKLFNGDIGICLADKKSGDLKVWFEKADNTLRSYSPRRLLGCQTAFAMTIHKSQGSEFNEVVVVLPREENKILSRQLVYTAVTRAKEHVKIVASKEMFSLALSLNIVRFSGLADGLRQKLSSPQ